MEMINVLKRLADLDAGNPNVKSNMTPPQSLTTVRDSILEESAQDTPESIAALAGVKECGMMGPQPAGSSTPHTPASIQITANSGDELSGMLRDIMSLAGVDKNDSHHEIEIGSPHVIEPSAGDDMAANIDLITKMSGDSDEADTDTLNIGGNDSDQDDDKEEKEAWDNSPDPEIEPHDYGDKQVKPKPQGLKQRMGDNPYKPASESVDSLAEQLLSEFHEFISEGKKKAKPDFLDMDKDGNKKEPMKKAVADKAKKAPVKKKLTKSHQS